MIQGLLCESRCVWEIIPFMRVIPGVEQGLEVWVTWLHHHRLLFLTTSTSLPLSFPSVIPLLSLHSCHFSPIFLAAFSPPPSSNHPLFCPLYYIRHMDQCTDMSLQICFCLLILHLLSPPLLDYSLIHLTNQTIKPRSTANRGNDMTLLERTCALCCCCLERNYNLISCLSQGKGFKLFLE